MYLYHSDFIDSAMTLVYVHCSLRFLVLFITYKSSETAVKVNPIPSGSFSLSARSTKAAPRNRVIRNALVSVEFAFFN